MEINFCIISSKNFNSDEPEKRHVFAARAEDNVVQWVMKLRESSYEYLRNKLHALQSKIYAITGKVIYVMIMSYYEIGNNISCLSYLKYLENKIIVTED